MWAEVVGRSSALENVMVDPASITILAVDDDADILMLCTAILRRAGYNVIAASTAAKALQALNENPSINLLFTDIKMPKIDGFVLADMAMVRRPNLKVIYATGFGDQVDTLPGIRHGPILNKPYSPERLREEVRLVLASADRR
jgi:DNA-binding NtrC family response regulator